MTKKGAGSREQGAGKRYVVANPRGLPAGSWILREEYDGSSLEHVIERGLVVEVSGGR